MRDYFSEKRRERSIDTRFHGVHHRRMFVETYIEAILADESVADEIWNAWNDRLIDDELALFLWRVVATARSATRDHVDVLFWRRRENRRAVN